MHLRAFDKTRIPGIPLFIYWIAKISVLSICVRITIEISWDIDGKGLGVNYVLTVSFIIEAIWFTLPFDVFCLRQVFVHLSVWQLCSLPLQWASLQWVVLGEKMHHLYKVRQYHLHAIIIRLLLSLPNRLLISFFAKILSVCQENVAGGFRLPIFWCLLPWLHRTEQRNLPKRYVNFL